MDIGASCINELPPYRRLLECGVAHLHAFEGDERQIAEIHRVFGDLVTVYPQFLFDGSEQTVYLATPESGMTSLLRPDDQALKFFNGFEDFGRIVDTERVSTARLDDVQGVPNIDFLKMDVQGAELTVLQHGRRVLSQAVAIQLEVSYIPLYENQPVFGEIDLWMRSQGFVPHCFLDVKRWSIAPTIRENNFRVPFNQLLESDILYVRNPMQVQQWSDEQVRKLAIIAHECLASVDLSIYLMLELVRRGQLDAGFQDAYLALINSPSH
jgi:FkbM family methyltransferase